MVSFICDDCQVTVKKNKVDQHCQRCSCSSISCIDCGKSYSDDQYKQHNTCISEAEKYEKSMYKPKAKNNESKKMNEKKKDDNESDKKKIEQVSKNTESKEPEPQVDLKREIQSILTESSVPISNIFSTVLKKRIQLSGSSNEQENSNKKLKKEVKLELIDALLSLDCTIHNQ